MGNPNLTWEKTSSFNLGLDFGFLDGRISGSIDYYWNHTYDLLFYKTAPASSFPTVIDNIGKTKGQGLEVSLMTTSFVPRTSTGQPTGLTLTSRMRLPS